MRHSRARQAQAMLYNSNTASSSPRRTSMRLFRRSLDLSLASPRPGGPEDLAAVSRLVRNSTHRFTSFPHPDLATLLAGAPAVLLAAGREIWGVAIAGWPSEAAAWIRTLAVADG